MARTIECEHPGCRNQVDMDIGAVITGVWEDDNYFDEWVYGYFCPEHKPEAESRVASGALYLA